MMQYNRPCPIKVQKNVNVFILVKMNEHTWFVGSCMSIRAKIRWCYLKFAQLLDQQTWMVVQISHLSRFSQICSRVLFKGYPSPFFSNSIKIFHILIQVENLFIHLYSNQLKVRLILYLLSCLHKTIDVNKGQNN